MDGVGFQHLDDGPFEQTEARPCNNVTRAAVEDEQQWGLEQCGCRQETEVRLARKSIGFLPTITSNSSSNGREQFLQRGHNHNFNSRGEFLAPTVQTTRREEFLPEAPLPLSFLRNGSTQHSVATRFTSTGETAVCTPY